MVRICALLACATAIVAGDYEDFVRAREHEFSSFVRDQERGIAEQDSDFQALTVASEREFRLWREQQDRELEAFKKNVVSLWGNWRQPGPRRWIEYGTDLRSRVIADFDSSVVRIEALALDGDEPAAFRRRIADAVRRACRSKGSRTALPVEAPGGTAPVKGTGILAGQLADEHGGVVTEERVDEFARHMAEKAPAEVNRSDGNGRSVVGITLPLAPDHVRRRAAPYLPLVEEYCARYRLDRAHVLATIHAESSFNAAARSSSNAIGLMQLVPDKGGREAYRFVYGDNRIPREEDLFDPRRNIELGCAYIHLLRTVHFGPVLDTTSRLYCSIAAYNTGPGNVAYAFDNTRSVPLAIVRINAAPHPREVYARLQRDLPFMETRDYLRKVVATMPLYKSGRY